MDFLKNIIDTIMTKLGSIEFIRSLVYNFDSSTFNYIFIAFIFLFSFMLLRLAIFNSRTKKLYIIPKKISDVRKKETSLFENLSYFKSLRVAISYFYFFRDKSERKEKTLNLIVLGVEAVGLTISIVMNNVLLGVLIVLMAHYIVVGIIKISSTDIDNVISQQLPLVIKHFIKTLSKTSDLKVVIYEVSKHAKYPLKSKLEQLSRKMLSDDDEKCLNEFADDINSVWMYTFVFLILSLKEHSKKEDVIQNLKLLARILDDNNTEKQKELSERRPMIMTNYAIAFLACLGFFGNVFFNKIGKDFFFDSFLGIIVMSIGIGLLLATILINTILAKKTGG